MRGRTLGAIAFVTSEPGRSYTEDDLALAQELASRAAVAIENGTLLQTLRESDRAKDVFLATLAVYLVATVLTAFSWNLASFAVCRFLTGFAIGGEDAPVASVDDR